MAVRGDDGWDASDAREVGCGNVMGVKSAAYLYKDQDQCG